MEIGNLFSGDGGECAVLTAARPETFDHPCSTPENEGRKEKKDCEWDQLKKLFIRAGARLQNRRDRQDS